MMMHAGGAALAYVAQRASVLCPYRRCVRHVASRGETCSRLLRNAASGEFEDAALACTEQASAHHNCKPSNRCSSLEPKGTRSYHGAE